jgi:hypothetical protein
MKNPKSIYNFREIAVKTLKCGEKPSALFSENDGGG